MSYTPSPFDLICPTCSDKFKAPPSSSEPRRFRCGHAVCLSCADAVAATPSPVCPVCLLPLIAVADELSIADLALGSFAEASDEDMKAEMPIIVLDHASSTLAAVSALPSVPSETLLPETSISIYDEDIYLLRKDADRAATAVDLLVCQALPSARECRASLASRFEAACSQVQDVSKHIVADCSSYADWVCEAPRRQWMFRSAAPEATWLSAVVQRQCEAIKQATYVHETQLKAIDAQLEEFGVRQAQLRACAAVCSRAACSRDTATIRAARVCADSGISALLEHAMVPCVAVDAPIGVEPLLAWMDQQRAAVAAVREVCVLEEKYTDRDKMPTTDDTIASDVAQLMTCMQSFLGIQHVEVACIAAAVRIASCGPAALEVLLSQGYLARLASASPCMSAASDDVLQRMSFILADYCEREDAHRDVAGANAVQFVVSVLKASANAPTVAVTARALKALVGGSTYALRHEGNICAFVALEGTIQLLNSLVNHLVDAGVCEWVCGAMYKLARSRIAVQALWDLTCLDIIFNVIRVHSSNGSVMDSACGVITNMAMFSEFKQAILNAGLLCFSAKILKIIYFFVCNMSCKCSLLKALMLSGCQGGSVQLVSPSNVCAGGIGMISMILTDCHSGKEALVTACNTVFNLSISLSSKERLSIGGSGIIQLLRRTAETNLDSAALQYYTFEFLRNLVLECPSNTQLVLENDYFTLMGEAVRCHARNPKVIFVTYALAVDVAKPDTCAFIVRSQLFSLSPSIADHFATDSKTLYAIVTLWAVLSRQAASKTIMQATACERICRAALTAHGATHGRLSNACRMLLENLQK